MDERHGRRLAGALVVAALLGCDDASDRGPASGESLTPASAPASSAGDDGTGPLSADGPRGVAPQGFTLVTIVITDADGNERVICVWLADAADERQRGLMGVTDLAGAEGMLFAYDEPSDSNFWMFGTPMPLSIAFLDAGGRFLSATDMEPCVDTPAAECRRYTAGREYTHALEVPRGGLGELGVGAGSRLRVVAASEGDRCAAV